MSIPQCVTCAHMDARTDPDAARRWLLRCAETGETGLAPHAMRECAAWAYAGDERVEQRQEWLARVRRADLMGIGGAIASWPHVAEDEI